MRFIFFILSICTIIYNQSTIAQFSFKKMYRTVVPHKVHQEVVYEELDPQKTTLITVKNRSGNVSIKTDPQQNNIFVKVIKKSADLEELPKVTFNHEIKNQETMIESSFDPDEFDGSVDFELIVPQKLAFNIITENGNTDIKEAHAPVRVTAQKGSITLINPHSTVEAYSQIRGNILLRNPEARVKLETNSGHISILDAQSSVIANTNNGSIEMFAREVPSTSTIKLATVSGSIMLHLPPDVNADLQASTKQGTITSDHFITLKPQTTQLNNQAWKRLQKQVDGTIGSGEAQIKLSSVKSNIKVLETKVS